MRRAGSVAWFFIGLAACNAIAGLDGDFTTADAGGTTSPEGGGTSGTGSSTSSTITSSSSTSSSSTSSSTSTSSSSTSTSSSSTSTSSSTSSSSSSSGTVEPFCFRPQDKPFDFCWNFNGANTAPTWGASEVYQNGGAPVVEVLTGVDKALHATNAKADSSSALVWNVTTADNTKHTRVLDFRFRVAKVGFYSAIAALQLEGTEHGLAVTTSNCGGGAPACFIENRPFPIDNDRTPSTASIPADTSWHDGRVTITYPGAANHWSGSVKVDGQEIVSRSDAIDAATQTKTYQVVAGAFYGPPGASGSTEVYVDDVRVHIE